MNFLPLRLSCISLSFCSSTIIASGYIKKGPFFVNTQLLISAIEYLFFSC